MSKHGKEEIIAEGECLHGVIEVMLRPDTQEFSDEVTGVLRDDFEAFVRYRWPDETSSAYWGRMHVNKSARGPGQFPLELAERIAPAESTAAEVAPAESAKRR